MTKYKVIGEKYGVMITKPFSAEMYKHNDAVKEKMCANIVAGIELAYANHEHNQLNIFSRALQGFTYGTSYTMDDVHEELLLEVENAQAWLLNQEYDYLVYLELVAPVEVGLVGFDK